MAEESQFNVQGYNIVTILKRLETATTRLEDIAFFQAVAHKAQQLAPAVESSRKVVANDGVKLLEETPKQVDAFSHFIEDNVTPFVERSGTVDPQVEEAAKLFGMAFKEQLGLLEVACKSHKPEMADPALMQMLKPINEKIERINQIRDANRQSQYYNHLHTISEGAPVLGWILGDTPVSLIPEFKDSAQFWSNRVLKEFKDRDPQQAEWVKSFLSIFDSLKAYVKEYNPTGPSWNPNGPPLAEILAHRVASTSDCSSSEQDAPSSVALPPPPPPPPAPSADFFATDEGSSKKSAGSMNAVFADLNKGEDITTGLKKVDKSQMTHKNPKLRDHVAASLKPPAPKKPSSLSSPRSVPQRKPACTELVDGTKWMVANHVATETSEPIVLEVQMHQSVFIGNCEGITVQLKGKANAVSVSQSSNTGIVVDSLVSGIDIIKCYKFGLQIIGTAPMVSIDKTDEGSLYLSKDSIDSNVQIFTTCSTAININVLKDEDYEELAIPEQFKHTIKDGKIVSEVVDHAG